MDPQVYITQVYMLWRIFGVWVGLPRHDVKVEGIVVKGDEVLELRVRCRKCTSASMLAAATLGTCRRPLLDRRIL